MALEIKGALFEIGPVVVSDGAKERAALLQARRGFSEATGYTQDMAASVHSAILLKFHALGDFGRILPSDRLLNRNNIRRNEGRVLSVIGEKWPFVIMTDLPSGTTLITTPEEVV